MLRTPQLVRALAASLAAASVFGACTRAPLSLQDQAVIYRAALGAASDTMFRFQPRPLFVLDPRLLPETVTTVPPGPTSVGLLDARIIRQLPSAGLCAPSTRDRECANGLRGLAVRLSVIRREAARRVSLWLLIEPVQATGDNTLLVGGQRFYRYRFVWRSGRWQRVMTTGSLSP